MICFFCLFTRSLVCVHFFFIESKVSVTSTEIEGTVKKAAIEISFENLWNHHEEIGLVKDRVVIIVANDLRK